MNMVPAENEGNLITTQESVSSWKVPQKITATSIKKLNSLMGPPIETIVEIGVVVRVKTCGKSARLCMAICITGKPYQKQDKKVCIGSSFRLNIRVCRIDKWLSG